MKIKQMTDHERQMFIGKIINTSKDTMNFAHFRINKSGELDIITPLSKEDVLELLMTVFDNLNTNKYNPKNLSELE